MDIKDQEKLFDKTLKELEGLAAEGVIKSIITIMVIDGRSLIYGRGEVNSTLASIASFLDGFPGEILLPIFTEILTKKGVNPQKPLNATVH